jgi:dipeptidyl aminopeptidase/acylaminoacyl peptidase
VIAGVVGTGFGNANPRGMLRMSWNLNAKRARTCRALAGFAALCFVVGVCWAATPKRAVTLEDLVNLETQPNLDVRLSPDGALLAMALSKGVQILDVAGKRVIADLGPGFLPEWAPDEKYLAFYSTRSGNMQLWLWDRRTKRTSQLTRFQGGIDPNPTTRVFGRVRDAFQMSWSPDASQIAFASRPPVKTASRDAKGDAGGATSARSPLVLTNSTPPEWTMRGIYSTAKHGSGIPESRDGDSLTYRDGTESFGQIFLADRTSGSVTQLTDDDATRFHPLWSKDGKAILCVETRTRGVDYGASETQIVTIELENRRPRQLTTGPGVRAFPLYSPDGTMISYMHGEDVFGFKQIHIMPVQGGASKAAFTLDRRISQYAWAISGDSFLIVYKDGTSIPLARIERESDRVEDISLRGRSALNVLTFTQSARGAIAWAQEDPRQTWSVRHVDSPQSDANVLMSAPGLDALALGEVEVVRWRNRSGETKEGTLLMPSGAVAGKKYPLIVDAYTTRSGADWILPLGGNQAWASMGYAVFRPSPRAPHVWVNPWKSEASSRAGKGPQGWNVTFDDVMSGVDELVKRRIVDPDRMCLFGHSNGGNVVNHLVTRTSRFRCAVSVAPAGSNLVRLLLAGGWNPSALNDGRPLEEHLDEYIALSTVFQLHQVETPMLLAAGDQDGDFLLNAIEIYNRLRARGKDVTLLRYPTEGHIFSGDALRDFWARQTEFFARHLQPDQSIQSADPSNSVRSLRN